MTHWFEAVQSARARIKVLVGLMAAVLLAVAVTSQGDAQTQKPAVKKPAPATQQAPQQRPAQQPQQAQQPQVPQAIVPQLIYRRWTKVCPAKDAAASPAGKQPCFIFMEGREDSGGLIVRVTIMEMEGEPRKTFIVSFLYGVDLPRGTRIVIDQGPIEATAPYVVCVPPNVPPPLFGCVSQYEITADMIASLKKGKYLTVQTMFNGQTLSPQLPLVEFAKAYDGPPTDLKAEAEQELKLQEALRERAKKKEEELTRKQAQPAGKK